ncbi:SRPBCC family protein [Streptomyces sp. YU58]|uniref:SRPBCC family protein n=1 Tax=Streptomyces sp. SX92 TaxID=3158972 RepID=UPI0027B928A4|nr:SRPBCC family protein [Streptomyces coralus]WLW57009.1 SRPBCC family protein [Streptomyces coralus]
MQLNNEFTVPLPIEDAWKLLTDLERVGPCLPGASITGREGDDYLGQAKIKVGPITTNYKGTARFTELDEVGHRAVLTASGREARGGGNASATVVAVLVDKGDETQVNVSTELALSGKVAQFGRGVITDVSAALLKTFTERLAAMLEADKTAQETATPPVEGVTALSERGATGTATVANSTAQRQAPTSAASAEDEVLDVLALTRGAGILRVPKPVTYAGLALLCLLIGWLLGRGGA